METSLNSETTHCLIGLQRRVPLGVLQLLPCIVFERVVRCATATHADPFLRSGIPSYFSVLRGSRHRLEGMWRDISVPLLPVAFPFAPAMASALPLPELFSVPEPYNRVRVVLQNILSGSIAISEFGLRICRSLVCRPTECSEILALGAS